jgi:hypothetical protein
MNNSMPYHFVNTHDMVAYDHFHQVGEMVEGMMP